MSESGMVRAKRTRERRVFVEAEKGEGVCGVWRSERVGECVWRGVMKNGKQAASGSTRRDAQAGLTRPESGACSRLAKLDQATGKLSC